MALTIKGKRDLLHIKKRKRRSIGIMTKQTAAIVAIFLVLAAFGVGYFMNNRNTSPPASDQSSQTDTPQPETNDTALDLSGQQLTTIPESVLSRTDLTSLNLSNNQLTTLPADIAKMTSLKILNVENNRLESLPAELESMTWLEQLDISNNRLSVDQQEQIKAKLVNTEVKT